MTFSYDETDDFDETDDIDEAEDFDEESEDVFPEEDDDDDPGTALSQAFRQATSGTLMDEDDEDDENEDDEDVDEDEDDANEGGEDEDDTDEEDTDESGEDEDDTDEEDTDESDEDEDDTDEEDTDESDEDEDDTDENDDEKPDAYEQQPVAPVDAVPDENEDDLDVELPPLELVPMKPEVEPFQLQEQSNSAYRDARTAYYEEKNYLRAIEKFDEAIEYEVQSTESSLVDANEIVAKSKYWQAEAYVKLQDFPQAIGTFEDLVKTCQGHYLTLAAQRRADQLNAKNS